MIFFEASLANISARSHTKCTSKSTLLPAHALIQSHICQRFTDHPLLLFTVQWRTENQSTCKRYPITTLQMKAHTKMALAITASSGYFMHGRNYRVCLRKTCWRFFLLGHVCDPLHSPDVIWISSAFSLTLNPLKIVKSLQIVRALLSYS